VHIVSDESVNVKCHVHDSSDCVIKSDDISLVVVVGELGNMSGDVRSEVKLCVNHDDISMSEVMCAVDFIHAYIHMYIHKFIMRTLVKHKG